MQDGPVQQSPNWCGLPQKDQQVPRDDRTALGNMVARNPAQDASPPSAPSGVFRTVTVSR